MGLNREVAGNQKVSQKTPINLGFGLSVLRSPRTNNTCRREQKQRKVHPHTRLRVKGRTEAKQARTEKRALDPKPPNQMRRAGSGADPDGAQRPELHTSRYSRRHSISGGGGVGILGLGRRRPGVAKLGGLFYKKVNRIPQDPILQFIKPHTRVCGVST